MILASKKVDLADLILKNMLEVFESKTSTGLTYGLL